MKLKQEYNLSFKDNNITIVACWLVSIRQNKRKVVVTQKQLQNEKNIVGGIDPPNVRRICISCCNETSHFFIIFLNQTQLHKSFNGDATAYRQYVVVRKQRQRQQKHFKISQRWRRSIYRYITESLQCTTDGFDRVYLLYTFTDGRHQDISKALFFIWY